VILFFALLFIFLVAVLLYIVVVKREVFL